jgi:hypothetical protein
MNDKTGFPLLSVVNDPSGRTVRPGNPRQTGRAGPFRLSVFAASMEPQLFSRGNRDYDDK